MLIEYIICSLFAFIKTCFVLFSLDSSPFLLYILIENVINILNAPKIKIKNEQLKQKMETLNINTVIDAKNTLTDLN